MFLKIRKERKIRILEHWWRKLVGVFRVCDVKQFGI